ncbi:MAG: winged helix-turn-helix domain-containing protein [Lentisphaeraceae bacterium]|nr:winged helix-turn-helix domain-containing protein [Lentisphaeraceae bacterium]
MNDKIKLAIFGDEESYKRSYHLNLESDFDCYLFFDKAEINTPENLEHYLIAIYFDSQEKVSQSELINTAEFLKGHIPLLVISNKYDEYDKILAYRIGVIDVIDQESTSRVLLNEKMKSLASNFKQLRRTSKCTELVDIIYGNWYLKADSLLLLIDSNKYQFTKTEFRILACLLEKPNELISKKSIKATLGQDINDRCLSVHICKIRKKLGKYGNYLETKVGKGVKLKLLLTNNKNGN